MTRNERPGWQEWLLKVVEVTGDPMPWPYILADSYIFPALVLAIISIYIGFGWIFFTDSNYF